MASTTPQTNAPDAPAYLPAPIAARWQAAYNQALQRAKLDIPDNDRLQRSAALKAANILLAVPAPKSAADIDALADWQVVKRETRGTMRICVTADGRKYSFSITAPAAPDLGKMTKDQLVQHAADNHDLTIDPSSSKAEMIAAIQSAAK